MYYTIDEKNTHECVKEDEDIVAIKYAIKTGCKILVYGQESYSHMLQLAKKMGANVEIINTKRNS